MSRGFLVELILHGADYETAEQAITDYLERSGNIEPDVICLAAAGPVVDGCVRLTNNEWVIDSRELRQKYPKSSVRLLNDFEAIAYSIPTLGENDISTVGLLPSELEGKSEFTLGVMGPGTGLGIGGLLGRENGIYPVVGEGQPRWFCTGNPHAIKGFEAVAASVMSVYQKNGWFRAPVLKTSTGLCARFTVKRPTGLQQPKFFPVFWPMRT